MNIHYAQCWEDPRTLMQALDVTSEDDVVSIASGGDNTLALLLANPRSLTAVDNNPAQLYLLELKMRAIEEFDYNDFVCFIGARTCEDRKDLYHQIRRSLSERAQGYWDKHIHLIDKGILHCGKFERYFKYFRRIVMPLIHQRKTILEFLKISSHEKQKSFYDRIWDNRRWRMLFHIFFGKFLLGHLGRDPSFFRHVATENIAEDLFRRTRYGFTEIPIQENFFVEYILTGNYSNLDRAHPYMNSSNFTILKERVNRLQLFEGSIDDYLKSLPPDSISKFNLSDIFEYISFNEVESTLREILRTGRNDARLAFWTLFVPKAVPSALARKITTWSFAAKNLYLGNRTFFYGNFCLWKVS
jgi:S-adenosylmethionine-diacylglycerol 3-amino-3-carboxypropyl transferase